MTSALRQLISAGHGDAIATIVRKEGHAYGKPGSRALYALDSARPLWGNIGSVCIDETVRLAVGRAVRSGTLEIVRIDTRDESDVDFGYGTYCGGVSDVWVEPLTGEVRARYTHALERVDAGLPVWIVYTLDPPRVTICTREPGDTDAAWVDRIAPPMRLVIFGATPLAEHVIRVLDGLALAVCVSDWRQHLVDAFDAHPCVALCNHEFPCDDSTLVLVMSHVTRRDVDALQRALQCGCRWIGLLSSSGRRDYIFSLLAQDGVPKALLQTISSPVGLDIGARDDAEIAVAIAAELVQVMRR